MKRKKKILILAANPAKSRRLRWDEEFREIEEGLSLAKYRDRFEIHKRFAVRIGDIARALVDIKPDIVHFCGHGSKKGIMVEDESGKAVWLQTEALVSLFQFSSHRVECVLLNACHSHAQATAINLYIDYVIGMNSSIKDSAAIRFAVGFYDALGAGRPYEQAFYFGKNAIMMDNQMLEATKPVFYSKHHTAASPQPVNQTVTLCYASEDKTAFAQPLGKGLKHYAEDIKINELVMSSEDRLVDKISSHTHGNEYVVVLLTPNSIDSDWAKVQLVRELQDSQEEDESRIIPVIFGDCTMPDVLKEFFYVDFRKFFAFGLKELLLAFSIKTRVPSEAETKKLLLIMLTPRYRGHVQKYVLIKDNSREDALKEAKKENLKYLIIGVVLWIYFLTWHPLALIPVFGEMVALIACFGVFTLGAFSLARYTHPKFAVEHYFKLQSRFDALIKEGEVLQYPAALYYKLLGKQGKRFYKKYRICENDLDHSLDKCNGRYLLYAGLLVGTLIFLTIYDVIIPKELKKTLTALQAIVAVWGFFVYTLYSGKIEEIREMYNLERDFEKLSDVYSIQNN